MTFGYRHLVGTVVNLGLPLPLVVDTRLDVECQFALERLTLMDYRHARGLQDFSSSRFPVVNFSDMYVVPSNVLYQPLRAPSSAFVQSISSEERSCALAPSFS